MAKLPGPSSCYLCGTRQLRVLSTRARFGLPITNVLCRRCGFIQQDPLPTAQAAEELYTSGSYIACNHPGPVEKLLPIHRREAVARIRWLLRHLDMSQSIQSVLEIGSHVGGFLEEMQALGVRVSGIELDPGLREAVRRRGMQVYACLEEILQDGETFDLICFFHLFEHIPEPDIFLENVISLLTHNGRLFLEVPNSLKPFTRRPHWYDWFDIGHVFSFSAFTLRQLLLRSKLEIEAVDSGGPNIMAICRPEPSIAASSGLLDCAMRENYCQTARAFLQFRSLHPLRYVTLQVYRALRSGAIFVGRRGKSPLPSLKP
jgi:SAM-dependent methyltransferase